MSAFERTFFAVTLFVSTTLLSSSPALGWGQTGHRVTGAIAEKYLSPLSQAALKDLLPRGSLAQASTYADEMRSDPSTFWRKTASPWHYVTVPEGQNYVNVGAPVEGDAVTALSHFKSVLLNDASTAEKKRLALRFIVHIIGDLHQPLHAGNGTDRGGNDEKLQFFWHDSNLHRVWDSEMLDQRKMSYTEWTEQLNRQITPQNIRQWASVDPFVWIQESIEIRDTIYPEEGAELSYDYLYNHLPIATERLQMAGIRIAMYLNHIFDSEHNNAS